MTTLETDLRPAEPERPASPMGRDVRYLVATAVLIVGVVAAVLLFGVQRPPALDPVTSGQPPEPPASLAWSGWTEDGDCVRVVDPRGTTRELTCDHDGGELVAWDDEGLVLLTWSGSGQRLETLDPDTGELVSSRTVSDIEAALDHEREFGDTALYSRWREGVLTVTEDSPGDTVLWAVEAPESYRVDRGVLAPDGRVVAGVDSAGRLLVFDAAGEEAPRLWHDDLPEWGPLVWEGTPLPERPTEQG
jgi:hypothetical protein